MCISEQICKLIKAEIENCLSNKTRMPTNWSNGRNDNRVVSSTGYMFRGWSIDEDWMQKARQLGVVAKCRDPTRLQALERAGLVRGYTEYDSGGGATALIHCIRSFQYRGIDERPNLFEMVRIFLENGANPFNYSPRWGDGVLHEATQIGDFELIHFILFSTFGNMESVKAWEPYPFETTNVLSTTQIYVTKLGFVNRRNKDGQTPLHIAIDFLRPREQDPTEIVEFLIENGADVNATDQEGRTPLFMCSVKRYSSIIDVLLEHGADVNAVNKHGETLLFEHNITPQVTEQLLHRGVDVNTVNRYGETPLHRAVHKKLNVQFLISHGANIEAIDGRGQTPIGTAVRYQHFESFTALFHANANLSIVDKQGETLLHLAARSENITRFLIECGANIDAVDNFGQTPLLTAAQCRVLPSAMLLWQAGADIYAENEEGDSAFNIGTQTWDPQNPIRKVIAAENDLRRKEAFAMSHHRRLGEHSSAHLLDQEMVRMVLERD